jgi:hypothetical protein
MSATEDELDHARTLLNRIPALQSLCDLDLLTFLARHPRTLIASGQLGRLLGYQLKEIAHSRDVLLAAGFLMRTQNLAGPTRMYAFATDAARGGPLSAVVDFASTREGLLALRRVLRLSSAGVRGPAGHGNQG